MKRLFNNVQSSVAFDGAISACCFGERKHGRIKRIAGMDQRQRCFHVEIHFAEGVLQRSLSLFFFYPLPDILLISFHVNSLRTIPARCYASTHSRTLAPTCMSIKHEVVGALHSPVAKRSIARRAASKAGNGRSAKRIVGLFALQSRR